QSAGPEHVLHQREVGVPLTQHALEERRGEMPHQQPLAGITPRRVRPSRGRHGRDRRGAPHHDPPGPRPPPRPHRGPPSPPARPASPSGRGPTPDSPPPAPATADSSTLPLDRSRSAVTTRVPFKPVPSRRGSRTATVTS